MRSILRICVRISFVLRCVAAAFHPSAGPMTVLGQPVSSSAPLPRRRRSVMSLPYTPELDFYATKLQLMKRCLDGRRALAQRKQAKAEYWAAVRMQAASRGRIARCVFAELMAQKQARKETEGATKLQAWKRGKDTRRLAVRLRHIRAQDAKEQSFLTKLGDLPKRFVHGDAFHGSIVRAVWTDRGINVEDCRLGFRILISRRRLQTLTLMALALNDIGDDGMQALCEAITVPAEGVPGVALPALSTLNLDSTATGALGAEALAQVMRSGHLPALRHLLMNSNAIGDRGMIAIASAIASRDGPDSRILELQLANNSIGEAGLVKFAQLSRTASFAELSWLRLDGNNAGGDAGVRALADSLNAGAMPALQTLYIGPRSRSSSEVFDAAARERGGGFRHFVVGAQATNHVKDRNMATGGRSDADDEQRSVEQLSHGEALTTAREIGGKTLAAADVPPKLVPPDAPPDVALTPSQLNALSSSNESSFRDRSRSRSRRTSRC